MTSHAQPMSTPPETLTSPTPFGGRHSTGPDKDKDAGPGNSVSVAKIGMIGTLGAALVTAGATIFVTANHDDHPAGPPTPTTITPPPTPGSAGTLDELTINGPRTEVAVAGSAAKDVTSVTVLIGPRQSGGQYWAATTTDVINQQWNVVVDTDPQLPSPYEIKAFYRERTSGTAGIPKASGLTFKKATPTPPPPPPGQEANCAAQFGDSCFTGPAWGPPSIYQGNQ
jgi:hypothetical protein